MKKAAHILSVLLLAVLPLAGASEPEKLRSLYYRAAHDKDDAERFYNYLNSASFSSRALQQGYTGMSYMFKAKYSINPYNMLRYFLKGKECLDKAIALDPMNAELRFLRYSVQTNVPAFLRYSGEVAGDRAVMIALYPALADRDLKVRIRNYMLNRKECPEAQKQIFKEPIS